MPFAFAGLWECWKPTGGDPIESCTVITTDANEVLDPVHDRMPVILPDEEYDRWLDAKTEDVPTLEALLRPYAPEEMTASPVSTLVNSPRSDCEACLTPLA